MNDDIQREAAEQFHEARPLLFGIAYRMLGSIADAEDVVQDAFLRWQRSDRTGIASPQAYLSSIVTRLCIDHLRSARVRREIYVGPWLPEPLITDAAPDASEAVRQADSLSMAFLALLEKLSPVERAVFLLKDVFDFNFKEIAKFVDRSDESCRQLATRARQRIAAQRRRFEVNTSKQQEFTSKFIEACTTGDTKPLFDLFAEDIVLYNDGGGKVRAARKPLYGRAKVTRYAARMVDRFHTGRFEVRAAEINGERGIVVYGQDGRPRSVIVLHVLDGQIQTVTMVVNPDKLRSIA